MNQNFNIRKLIHNSISINIGISENCLKLYTDANKITSINSNGRVILTVFSMINTRDTAKIINILLQQINRILLIIEIRDQLSYKTKDIVKYSKYYNISNLKKIIANKSYKTFIDQHTIKPKNTVSDYNDPVVWSEVGDMEIAYNENILGWDIGYSVWDDQTSISLDYLDGIKLFYHYFKSFETYVEKFLGEKYSSQDWFKEFKKELPKLEEIYNGYVKSGDIDDSDVEIFEPTDEEIKEFREELGKLELE